MRNRRLISKPARTVCMADGVSGFWRVGAAILLALSLLLMTLAGSRAEARNPLSIVTTIAMVGDITQNVAGDRADVIFLMGSGVDPHLYKTTRSDVSRMLRADAIFYNGLLLEGKMTDALVRVATRGKPVFAVTELIDEAFLLQPPEFEGHADPHVWMDPTAWTKAVEVVRDRLVELDPASAGTFKTNADMYLQKLERLDAYAREVLNSVPESKRILVTAHDAFAYFGRRYGFEVMGIQGISTESEAGLKRIEELVNVLVDRDIPAVFVESTIPRRSVEALIAGAQSRGHTVEVGGELFSDAMGKPGTYEGTYIGMIDHNVTTIARALGGKTPPRGLNGQLAESE